MEKIKNKSVRVVVFLFSFIVFCSGANADWNVYTNYEAGGQTLTLTMPGKYMHYASHGGSGDSTKTETSTFTQARTEELGYPFTYSGISQLCSERGLICDISEKPLGGTWSKTVILPGSGGIITQQEYWYDPYVPVCDTALATYDWTNKNVRAFVENCDDTYLGATLSGCDPSTFTENIITKNGENFQAEAKDVATNLGYCEISLKTKIDRNIPRLVSGGGGIQLKNHDGVARTLLNSEYTIFEANETFGLILNAEDPPADSMNGQAGLNWNVSAITISGPSADTSMNTTIGSLPAGVSFDIGTKTVSFSDASDIFEKAGLYTISLIIRDNTYLNPNNAGVENELIISGLQVQIVASEIDQNNSTVVLQDFCNEGDLLANNQDKCEIEAILFDRFQNPILKVQHGTTLDYPSAYQRQITTSFNNQNSEGTYDILNAAEEAFRNGVRFDTLSNPALPDPSFSGNIHQFVYTADDSHEKIFNVQSIIPTVEIIKGQNGRANATLLKRISRDLDINIEVQDVNPDGAVITTQETLLNYKGGVNFDPWVKLTLTDNACGEDPTQPLQYPIGSQQTVNQCADTNHNKKDLPASFDVFLRGWESNDSISFESQPVGGEENGGDGFKSSFAGVVSDHDEERVYTHFRIEKGVLIGSDLATAFTSKVQHDVIDVNGTLHHLMYPGGSLGNSAGGSGEPVTNIFDPAECGDCPGEDATPVSSIIVGADIEGQTLVGGGNTTSQSERSNDNTSRIIQMGGFNVRDIRENITSSAYELIRGMAANEESDRSFDISTDFFDISTDFIDGKVSYYKGGLVRLEGGVLAGGQHTIIIEDGNLIIEGDIQYGSAADSLGVILINSIPEPEPETGNIFIAPLVQRFVGTYFADGGLTSTGNISTPSINETLDRDMGDKEGTSILNKQLLLEGTLFTRNTLGGGMMQPFIDPWGTETGDITERAKAQRYDLHFVRRYYEKVALGPSGLVVTNTEDCLKTDGTNCDPNKHAFIIRPDGRVQSVPPPGFEQ